MERNGVWGGLITALGAAVISFSVQAGQGNDRFIVGFKAGKSAEARAAVTKAGGRVVLDLANYDALAIELPAAAIKGIQHNPNVSYVENDAKRYPMAEITPFGIAMVQANHPSLTQPDTSSAKKVCIIDLVLMQGTRISMETYWSRLSTQALVAR